MSSFAAKKVVRTYSRQTKRPLYDEEPPTKRRRVETTIEKTEVVAVKARVAPSILESSDPTRDVSTPPTSSPKDSPAIFSDEAPRSSPPSSPTPRSSPPAQQKRRPLFSIFKKQAKPNAPSKQPLSEGSQDAQSPPKQAPKKKHMVQMQLDLASENRKTCKTCGMQYIPSNADDAALHKKFHAMNLGGVDFTKPVIERFRKNQVWSGGDNAFIAVVGRKDALAVRNRASDVLKIVTAELAAVPISDDELWSQTGPAVARDEEIKASKSHASASVDTKQALVDRFKVYLYFRGTKCVGACLAERIWDAFAVLGKTDTSTHTSETCELPVAPQSSSISISSTRDPAILGISRIWTSNQSRKRGIASRLLETVRSDFQYGLVIEKGKIAFSQPTESGGKLARKWFGSQAGWHVYID